LVVGGHSVLKVADKGLRTVEADVVSQGWKAVGVSVKDHMVTSLIKMYQACSLILNLLGNAQLSPQFKRYLEMKETRANSLRDLLLPVMSHLHGKSVGRFDACQSYPEPL
jgi:hypothetical protein